MSLKHGLRGAVAKIILDNLDYEDDIIIGRWMRDVSLNGVAYSDVKGMRYHNELVDFYNKHSMDIEVLVWDYETGPNGPITINGSKESAYAWYAFETTICHLMNVLHIT